MWHNCIFPGCECLVQWSSHRPVRLLLLCYVRHAWRTCSGYFNLWKNAWRTCSGFWPKNWLKQCLLQIWTLTLISYERYLTCLSSVKRLSHKQVWHKQINGREGCKYFKNISDKYFTNISYKYFADKHLQDIARYTISQALAFFSRWRHLRLITWYLYWFQF